MKILKISLIATMTLLLIGISNANTTQTDANKLLEYRIDENKVNIEKSNAQIKETIQCTKSEIEKTISDHKGLMTEKLNLYLFFVGGGITLIGFLLNYFGKDILKQKIDIIIMDKVNLKITELIKTEKIEGKVDEISRQLLDNKTIEIEKQIRSKADEIFKEEIAKYKKDIEKKLKSIALQMKNLMGANLDITKPMTDELKKSLLQYIEFIKNDIDEKEYSITDYEMLGMDAYNRQEFNEAEKYYRVLMDKEPQEAMWYFNLGLCLHEKEIYEEAIKVYSKALEINSELSQAYNNRGNCYYDLNDYDNAINDFNRAIKIDNNYYDAYINRANTFCVKMEYINALADYKYSLNSNNNNIEILTNIVELLIILEKYIDAIAYLEIISKFKLNSRNKSIYLFTKILNNIMLDIDIENDLIKYKESLKEEYELNLNFIHIDNWLKTAKFEKGKESKITAIINLIKDKQKPNE